MQQALGDVGDFDDGCVEGGLVCFRRFVHAAYFSDKLEGSGFDAGSFSGFGRGAKNFDAAAHAKPVSAAAEDALEEGLSLRADAGGLPILLDGL